MQLKSSLVADGYTIPSDITCLSIAGRLHAEALLACCKQHYVHRARFSPQLAEYKTWCIIHIQFDRPGRADISGTWLNSEKCTICSLGFAITTIKCQCPQCSLFLSLPLTCHYVSFHIAAKPSHLTGKSFCMCAKLGGKYHCLGEGLEWVQALSE